VQANQTSEGRVDDESPLIAARYRIDEELSRGGMGAVYRALDQSTGRAVAIKRLLAHRAENAAMLKLFQSEYRTLAGLRHPRIIDVYDYGHDAAEAPYYTMELLTGSDLRALAPLPYREAAKHLRDVASSLGLLHAHRLLHRDVSPTNVRLNEEGRAKLIDFGALIPFGPAEMVVGTAPCLAPEALDGASLDQRADLYALGALAYFTLSGRHAYPAKNFEVLKSLWQAPVTPLATLVPELPTALCELVSALMSLDPLARPSSAAEVIERLNGIAELAPEATEGPRSYLLSSSMVGRGQEMRQLARRLSRLEDGQGGAVMIEGEAGFGKTRMLRELAIEARLRGFPVLAVSSREHPGHYGVARALATAALHAFPAAAVATLRPYLPVLGHALPELVSEDVTLDRLDEDPVDRWLRIRAAFLRWLQDLGDRHAFVITLDDAHKADPASLGLLAALSRGGQHRVLVGMATRRAEATPAESALSAFCSTAEVLRLRPLRSEDTEQLVETLFGGAPDTARVAQRLHGLCGGNPLQCVELADHLVTKAVIRYADGAWVLPPDIAAHELPGSVEHARAERIAALEPEARELAEVLSVHRGIISHALCRELAASEGHAKKARATLRVLVADGVLLESERGYTFAHDPLRKSLVRGLEAARRQALHRHFAEALLRIGADSNEARMEAGFHLVRAGDTERGAELLDDAGAKVAALGEGLLTAVPALEEALFVYRKQGRTSEQCLRVLLPLVAAGQAGSRRLVHTYGKETFSAILQVTGLALASRLRPWLGRRLSIYAGFAYAALRYVTTPARDRMQSLRDTFVTSFAVAVLLVASYLSMLDSKRIRSFMAGLSPLGFLPESSVPRCLYELCRAFQELSMGRHGAATRILSKLATRLEDPSYLRGLAEPVRKRLFGGVLLPLGLCQSYRAAPPGVLQASKLEALQSSFYYMGAVQLRMLYHAHRGEMEAAHRFRDEVELLAVQGDSTWQMEIYLPTTLGVLYDLTRDVIGLKRSVEQVDRLAQDIAPLSTLRDVLRAAYLGKQGRFDEAIALFEQVFAEHPMGEFAAWMAAVAQFADTLNAAGKHERALALCRTAFDTVKDDDPELYMFHDSVRRQHALAEAGLGRVAEAAALLDALIVELAPRQNPLQSGLAKRDRAEVALLAGDRAGFENHFAKMDQCFRATANPALVAQSDRLHSKGVAAGFLQAESAAEVAKLTADLKGRTAGVERAKRVLEVLLRSSRAPAGKLYVFVDGALSPLVGLPDEEGSARLRDEVVQRKVDAFVTGTDATDATGTRSDTMERTLTSAGDPEQEDPGQLTSVLYLQEGMKVQVVGAIALARGATPLIEPSYKVLNTIARALR